MRKLIVILLCFPLFLFSQEERKYERTMSLSQFAKELKQAADKGIDYTLENCEITYDPIRDKKYIKTDTTIWGYKRTAVIKDLEFSDSTMVIINSCRFLSENDYNTIQFLNCSFWNLHFSSIANVIKLDSANVRNLRYYFNEASLKNEASCGIRVSQSQIKNFGARTSEERLFYSSIFVSSSTIDYINVGSFDRIWINNNTIKTLLMGQLYSMPGASKYTSYGTVLIEKNIFESDIGDVLRLKIKDSNNWDLWNIAGVQISNVKIEEIAFRKNTIKPLNILNFDFSPLLNASQAVRVIYGSPPIWVADSVKKQHPELDRKNKSWSPKQKIDVLEKIFNKNDIKLKYHKAGIRLHSNEFGELLFYGDTLDFLSLRDNQIKKKILIDLDLDSLLVFKNNAMPDYNRININSSIFKSLGFLNAEGNASYGLEKYQSITEKDAYLSKLDDLTESYRLFTNILHNKGSDLKSEMVIHLKNIQTNKREFEYYENPNIERWFNWKGSVFLRWYSDYGTNPFKALAFCFKAMLCFAMFYFIFYNDWDKIDRGFLIKRFNSVMDYFTTEKRIEDFYSSTHDKEMTTFTDFKDTLEKNKVYMPGMLASLAKPIYQISLLRYKLLNFSYKKAEFMAGRKWIDLEKKDRYWIGTLTFFLTLTYIIYLVFIRALNSIVLSINAFSTLGFGTIPVRGFTKYVAIIEGFIGWFLLSVFIVSLLSQMMSV